MIRGKKGMKIEDRFKRDVLGSHIFKVLFYNRPELMKVVAEKVVPIQSDLLTEKLGLAPADRKRLTEELDVILSSAASIDFTELLSDMLKIDYFGPVKMLALALECKNPNLVFNHVSTAYVNS